MVLRGLADVLVATLFLLLTTAVNSQIQGCQDNNSLCNIWADRGVCASQEDFMRTRCPRACGLCPTATSPRPEIVTAEPGCTTSSGASGQCVNIRDCPSLVNLLEQVKAGTVPSDSLRKAICEFKNNVPHVCCPPTEKTIIPKTGTHIISETEKPIIQRTNTLPTKCGVKSFVDRIINGQNAGLGAWPWMALLESRSPEGGLSPVCGGVLISERYVLTAAHCVTSESGFSLENVRLGEHTISKNPDCSKNVCAPSYQRIPVEETIIHEDYGSPHGCRRCNDIALLRLSRPVQLNTTYVQPICIPQNLQRDLGFSQDEFTSKVTWVAGWGTTRALSHQKSDVLQEVQVPINNGICGIDYDSFPNPNMVLCAGGEKKDTCRGDSGGPMMMSNQRNTKFYLVGIVSKGPRVCGAPNTGGIYTNINHYVPWILRKL